MDKKESLLQLFNETLACWNDWGRVFQSARIFEPLVHKILADHNFEIGPLEPLPPGTHAVFKVGLHVVKVFAPEAVGYDPVQDQTADRAGNLFAYKQGVPVSSLIVQGMIEDAYPFYYTILPYYPLQTFTEWVKKASYHDKLHMGGHLRTLTDRMNVPLNEFNDIDVLQRARSDPRWKAFSKPMQVARLSYLDTVQFNEKRFVHGDLNGDNILVRESTNVTLIDFGDACLATLAYEWCIIAIELFAFDGYLMQGFFGVIDVNALTETLLEGLLIHDFGGDVITQRLGLPISFTSLNALRNTIRVHIERSIKESKNPT